ncbi:hypothetical protein [Chryseosolibacter indicus]|uniref:Uncharacterized protein n=1 Tax=Chryseosolibacter indicus TaxID=2782351 RepID=A0ABS5VLK1_9BACT|nr:hypothetical protein [Chryseosolibacter indicus]MBT1702325.1 hypothetical protein [Chryseosolibacter indicus]
MRLVKEISNPDCKITIFAWNNRYLIKLEQGFLEQTFKVEQWEISGDEDLDRIIDAEFVQQALIRFQEMGQAFYEARERSGL